MDRKLMLAIVVLGISAFFCKSLLAWNTLGTNDMLTWETFARFSEKFGPALLYEDLIEEEFTYSGRHFYSLFNHPPLMALGLPYLLSFPGVTGIPFRTMFRILISLADAGTLLFVCLAIRGGRLRTTPAAICALAACPISIMIAGFHGNTDPIMIFFLVVSAYALESWESPLLCGLFLGLACEIKVVPTLLVPALLLYLPTWRDRVVCMAAFLFTALLPAMLFAGSIGQLLNNIFGYAAPSGSWGSTWLWKVLRLPWLAEFAKLEKFLMIAVMLAASVWMNVRRRPSLFTQWGILLFLFLFLTPGFGVQYLMWLVPWVITLGTAATLTHYALSGLFAFVAYTSWCNGFPWYFANAWLVPWHSSMAILSLLAWLSTLFVLLNFWRELTRNE
jgi:hypothetical protein